jgi:hypothetical protein
MGTRADLSARAWRLRMSLSAVVLLGASVVSAISPSTGFGRVLPDRRAYELVSPADKSGADGGPGVGSSQNGERFAYYTLGLAPGAPQTVGLWNSYVALRELNGWVSRPMLPAIGYPNIGNEGTAPPADFSKDLSKSISLSRGVLAEAAAGNVFTTDLNGSETWVTRPAPNVAVGAIAEKAYAGRSADASHIFFESSQPFTNQAGVQGSQVWEWVDGRVRLASVLPDGTSPPSGAQVGDGSNGLVGEGTGFNGFLPQPDAVSEDGNRVFFQAGSLYVRESGATTRGLSLSQRAGSVGHPSNGVFIGASADGNVAVFRSSDQLTDDATPNGGLYAFDLRTGVLRFLSSGAADPNGAQVEGMSLVSRDGSRVYFVASSVLVPGKGVAGGHNLYVANASGVHYIATLGNDDAQDWSVGPITAGRTTRATRDGRYLVFQSYEQLTGRDNGGRETIYLYDDAQGTITCVSCGGAGHAVAGDASIFANPVPRQGGLLIVQVGRPRTITDDGSRIYFQTTDALVPEDVNPVADVYEYRRDSGQVALISAGTGARASEILDNTPDGRDVFFMTRDSLLKRDIDGGGRDIYDARVDGGFPDPPDPVPCAGDACQAMPGAPPAPLAPSTDARASGSVKDVRAPRLFLRRITDTGRKNVLKTGRLTLVASVEAAGTITASGTAAYGDHKVYKLKSAKSTAKAAGTKYLRVSLPRAVMKQLRRHKRVTLSITVSYNKATHPAHVALTLR